MVQRVTSKNDRGSAVAQFFGKDAGTSSADVRQYGPAYRQNFSDQILPSHRQAMCAIEQCRTDGLGGKVYACPQCG